MKYFSSKETMRIKWANINLIQNKEKRNLKNKKTKETMAIKIKRQTKTDAKISPA